MTEIRRYVDPQALAQASAEYVVELAQRAIEEHGIFRIALSGGSTPKAMHRLLAKRPLSAQIDWTNVEVYWGDERAVPPEHELSNFRMARETLLNHLPIPQDNIYRIRGELDPEEASIEYGRLLKVKGTYLDLILLGMGDDGHTASLFPHTDVLYETKHRCQAHFVEKLDSWRITMTADPMINQARHVAFMVSGEGKAKVLNEVINGLYQPEKYPSQLIKPIQGDLVWFIDEPAAKYL